MDMENIDETTLNLAKKLFEGEDPYDEKSIEAFQKSLSRYWFTKQYFSIGRNSLVLPGWIIDQLGPKGEGRHGFAGIPILGNSDHRNYYILGGPNSNIEPLVDHKGGILPTPNSYTLIFGTFVKEKPLYSSEVGEVTVNIHDDGFPILTVKWEVDGDILIYECSANKIEDSKAENLQVDILRGFANHQLLLTLTPFDQDGLTQIPEISWNPKDNVLELGDHPNVFVSEKPVTTLLLPAKYGHAGKSIQIQNKEIEEERCQANTPSWACSFPVRSSPSFTISLNNQGNEEIDSDDVEFEWEEEFENLPQLNLPDEKINSLFKSSAVILRLLADNDKEEVTIGAGLQEFVWLPGLYYQLKALGRLGYAEKIVKPALSKILRNVKDEGIEDINQQWFAAGSLLAAVSNYYYFNRDVSWIGENYSALRRIADWIIKLRKKNSELNDKKKAEILPEGNGPFIDPMFWIRDNYYFDNFWNIYGLQQVAKLGEIIGKRGEKERLDNEVIKYKQALDNIITTASSQIEYLPVSVNQKENASILFNLYAFYPLELYIPDFQPISKTLKRLCDDYVFDGGLLLFQPWNAYGSYSSILLAQALRYVENYAKIPEIIKFLKNHVTNAQGWAEGISPLSFSGSVGDSPNGIASAEWVNFILDLFADEKIGDSPILLKGMPLKWLSEGVSAESILLEDRSTIDLQAKLTGKVLKLEWDYTGSKRLKLATPSSLASLPKGMDQISTRLYFLPDIKGSLELKMSDE